MRLKLNCYPVIPDLEEKLEAIIKEGHDNQARELEIAYGEGAENVKKRILNFLNKKEIRKLYSRMTKTDKGWGRIFVYFRH